MSEEQDLSSLKKYGSIVNKPAPDFTLADNTGGHVVLSKALESGPALLVFYTHDFHKKCTEYVCDYKDRIDDFAQLGIQLFGISPNDISSHSAFSKQYDFPFLLLSDPEQRVAKEYGCSSLLTLGRVSRAVFLVNKKQVILYKYLQLLTPASTKSEYLYALVSQLRKNKLI